METILHLPPLTGAQKTAFQATASESKHPSLPTNDHGGTSSIPQEWREHTTILFGYVPSDQLKTFPDLKWVQSWNTGVNPYLAPGVLSEGVHLASVMGAYGPAVSEHMLAMLLAIYKRLLAYRDQQRAYIWVDLGPIDSLAGKTVLVGGAGDVGRHFARLVCAPGVQRAIGLHRSAGRPVEGFDEIYGLGMLDGLLSQVDVVALVLPRIPETVGLISKARLLAMGPGTVLFNAGRGSAVDCTALTEVLCPGRLLGAELDATDPEPLSLGRPLWEAPSLLLVPRTTGGYNYMEATLERIKVIFLGNLRRYMEDRTLRS